MKTAREDPKSPVIWIIEAEHWPRALIRAELIERGFDAVGYENVRDAEANLRTRFPDVIVVEHEDIAPLRNLGVPIIELRRPVSIGEIAEAVQRLVSTSPGDGSSR